MNLEYVLDDTGETIYIYEEINLFQLRTRLIMNYIIIESKVFDVIGKRKEGKNYKIYIKKNEEEFASYEEEIKENLNRNIVLHIREFKYEKEENIGSKLILEINDIMDHEFLFDNYFLVSQIEINSMKYNIDSYEFNEDLCIFVIYVDLSEDQR